MQFKSANHRLFLTMDDVEAEKFALDILRVVEHRKALAAIEPHVLHVGELMQRIPLVSEEAADLNITIAKGT